MTFFYLNDRVLVTVPYSSFVITSFVMYFIVLTHRIQTLDLRLWSFSLTSILMRRSPRATVSCRRESQRGRATRPYVSYMDSKWCTRRASAGDLKPLGNCYYWCDSVECSQQIIVKLICWLSNIYIYMCVYMCVCVQCVCYVFLGWQMDLGKIITVEKISMLIIKHKLMFGLCRRHIGRMRNKINISVNFEAYLTSLHCRFVGQCLPHPDYT